MRLQKKSTKKTQKASSAFSSSGFVGVNISDHSVKMVQISGRSLGQVRVENYAIVPLPSNTVVDGKVSNMDDLVVTLQQVISSRISSAKNIILGVPSQITTVQNFVYHNDGESDLEGSAEFEAAQISPIEDINFDFQSLGSIGKEGTEETVILVATKKEDMDPFLGALEGAQIDPIFVDCEITARVNAFSNWINNQFPELEREVVAIFDIGEHLTQAEFVQSGKILFRQDVSFAGIQLTHAIQRTYQLSMEESEHLKTSEEKPVGYDEVANSYNAELAQEIQRIMQFFYTVSTQGSSQNISRIVLTGGGSLSKGLAEVVMNNTGIPTQLLHPVQHVSVSNKINTEQFKQDAARLTVAFGLALRGLV